MTRRFLRSIEVRLNQLLSHLDERRTTGIASQRSKTTFRSSPGLRRLFLHHGMLVSILLLVNLLHFHSMIVSYFVKFTVFFKISGYELPLQVNRSGG